MKTTDNHIFIGKEDKLNNWAGHKDVDRDELTEEEMGKLTKKVKELIKNYLQLDNVNFLFGTGSSIHLGAASIQNIPSETEKYILDLEDEDLKNDFKSYVERLQDNMMKKYTPVKDVKFQDDRNWDLIYDGTYIRDYKDIVIPEGEEDSPEKHYGEVLVMFESLLNYLTAITYQKDAEHDEGGGNRVRKLIEALKGSLFLICDVHNRITSERDLKRIEEKKMSDAFAQNKYIFHEKFLKSLMQRPLNLQRANIFTSNYDLAFEYAFDNLGIKYIDGFSGFHHRYFKLHGSISWVSDNKRTANNIYGIEEMPIDLIKRKAADAKENDFGYGNLMIYPTAVKKSYTLDLPYSELFRHFAYCTSQPQSVLFTIGYSFCDEHFNDIIYQALSNPSFTLIIIDFNGTKKSEEIKRLRDLNDPRIIILEGDFLGDFLTLADTLMPDFLDASSNDDVAETLNKLIVNKE